jgi:ADP-heptose:LPS heptosyltransferase
MNAYPLQNSSYFHKETVDPPELEYLAFTGQFERVRLIFHRVPREDRSQFANKHILNQAIWGGIQKLRELLAVHAEAAAEKEKFFIDDTLKLFIEHCKASQIYPRELFLSIHYWSDELVKLSLPDEALHYIRETLQMGINKYPDIHVMLLSRMAQIFSDKGDLPGALSILSDLSRRPFLITDRNQVPEILFKLGKLTLLNGDVDSYKKLLLSGLRHFYTDIEDRRLFVQQLTKTYRHSYRLFLDRKIGFLNKFLFFIHWLYYKLPDFRRVHLGFVNKTMKLGILGYVYALNYLRGSEEYRVESYLRSNGHQNTAERKSSRFKRVRKFAEKHNRILITRAMGGIGDLLTMTPGLHALRQKYPGKEIHFAIPKRYFSVFANNPDVKLIDIEKDRFDYRNYHKWFNLTDCPAARVESLTAPRVKRSRIDIFARALGLQGMSFWKMDRRPRYFLAEEDKAFRESFWREHRLIDKPVVGVQLYADEVYRDYPYMKQLVEKIARRYKVLVFDAETIEGYDFENVIKVDSYSIRQAFALASGCDMIIAPDSAFLHLSAAFNIPCVALFGPIDGKVRTKHYPYCEYLDARESLGCVACWRNENIPCKLTNMRTSVCMGHIPVARIINVINKKLMERKKDACFEQNL